MHRKANAKFRMDTQTLQHNIVRRLLKIWGLYRVVKTQQQKKYARIFI